MKKIILLIVVLLITTLANAQTQDYRICTKSDTVYTPCSNSINSYSSSTTQTVYLHPGDLLYYCYSNDTLTYKLLPTTVIWRLGTPPYANNIDTSTSTPILSGYQDSIISTKHNTTIYRYTRIKFLPGTAGTISGLSNVCQGTPITFTTPSINYAESYEWTLNGVVQSDNDTSITLNLSPGPYNLTVTGKNAGGNGDTSAIFTITVNPLPIAAGTISGAATACQGQNSVTYNVPTIANATSYIWTLPSGATGTSTTNSITVNYGLSAVSGNITVKGHNSCGDGAIATLPITVNSLVANAGTISGTAIVCQGQNSVTYTVPSIANAASYIWTLPNGVTGTSTTNSITVNYGASAVSGNITVKGHNDCGDGTPSTFAITVNPLPTAAGTISGATTACQGQNSVTYNVPTIANALSYIWTLPIGVSGSSNTNSITVNIGAATSGNITVKGHNDCGDGAISSLPITITQTPATPTISNIGNNVLSSSSTSGNQWYNQDGIINGAVSQNYTTTANGSYYCIVSNASCSSNPSNSIQITNTGIENMNSNGSFTVYPNPTKSSLNISVNQKLIGSEFTISDQLGRKVITGKLTAENTVVEVGNLSNGIYLLRIGENGQQTFKVVKE